MKKVLVIALLSLAAVSSWAQGTVQFQNGQITFITQDPTGGNRLVYKDTIGGTKLTGTNYAAALYYVPGADQGNILMTRDGGTQAGGLAFFRPGTTTVPGVWSNPLAVGNTRTLDGVAISTFATLQVRVWDTVKYVSFADAFSHNDYGWSVPFNFHAPDFAHGDPASAAYMEGLQAFAMVPEPSTIALGVLGVVGLLALRRRNSK